jgi:hypothetical protein
MASDSGFDIGDVVRLVRWFKDEAGEPAEPDDVQLIVTTGDGVTDEVTTHPVTDEDELLACSALLDGADLGDGTGVHSALLSIDGSGLWRYEWRGTGGAASTEPGSFLVRRRRVGTVGS